MFKTDQLDLRGLDNLKRRKYLYNYIQMRHANNNNNYNYNNNNNNNNNNNKITNNINNNNNNNNKLTAKIKGKVTSKAHQLKISACENSLFYIIAKHEFKSLKAQNSRAAYYFCSIHTHYILKLVSL